MPSGAVVAVNIILVLLLVALIVAHSKISWLAFLKGPDDKFHKFAVYIGYATGVLLGPAFIPILSALLMASSCSTMEQRAKLDGVETAAYLEEAKCDTTLSKDTLVKDLDPCAVCNVVGESIVGYIGIVIMVYFAYRTTLVDGELDNITLHANPANMDGDVRVVEKQEAAEEGKAKRCEGERCRFCRCYRGREYAHDRNAAVFLQRAVRFAWPVD